MRLHHLEVTAFGPFVDTVAVDFDALAAGGLFLLTGATGAGKTSVLDAVCFGLYGEVPGERHAARQLRSDHAPADAEPRVVLRASVGSRSFRFTRSPAWDRPKRRGEGTRRIQAGVLVEEHRDGAWEPLTTRLDEAGHLVGELLGMTVTQFTQVAMLPQGRFQSFLRASSAERHQVLQRLFRTRRYEDVERWLAERRTALRRDSLRGHDRCRELLSRLQEAGATPVPDAWQPDDLDGLGALVDDGDLAAWTARLVDDAATELERRTTSLAGVTETLRLTRDLAVAERERHRARQRGARARTVLAELDRTTTAATEAARRLDAHVRAVPLVPHARRVEAARLAAEQAATALATELRDARVPPDPDELHALAAAAADERATARAWLPRERELEAARQRADELDAEAARLGRRVELAEEQAAATDVAASTLAARVESARTGAAEHGGDLAAEQSARSGLAAARDAEEVAGTLVTARARLTAGVQQVQDLREVYLDLREQRISGMAAELATGLAAGCSCPVCGSAEHPAPAVAAGRVGRAEEDAARQQVEDADFERQAVAEQVRVLEAQLASARARAEDLAVTEWQQRVATAGRRLQRSAEAVRLLAEVELELGRGRDRAARARTELAALTATAAERGREAATTRDGADTLARELAALLEPHAAPTVSALVARLQETERVLAGVLAALEVGRRADVELAAALGAAHHALGTSGHPALEDAVAAVLPHAEATALETLLEGRRVDRADALRVLAEPDVLAAEEQPPADLETLEHDLRRSETARDHALGAHRHATARATRVRALADELDAALAAWAPVRHRHLEAARLGSLVEGTSSDNRLRMRLSAYVLSERLRQVVAAANERLAAMTDERFTLEQVDEKGAGEQRGGLSLRVRDEWSGTRRDPATLSGGETFVVSLALALGLADTVSHEAGGTTLDTLFIDEGFGALDAATLDGVMDTLDSLRDGGRVVGLVSHVTELRSRVTSQLEVHKDRRGSTVAAVLASG
ncbi:exonuclease SbcC [Nocardioides scoriae]|uniref:Nuclease SbcCD subunit C n=1 Tax=Nocardioides scoriae TaxID=642780 RepID=A0A1H1NTE1_9ACTN|nr:AAA family ATPase [Nocardioides scoriae]SDS02213.1 exonuclease SbcC [Nocardioides scoriae]